MYSKILLATLVVGSANFLLASCSAESPNYASRIKQVAGDATPEDGKDKTTDIGEDDDKKGNSKADDKDGDPNVPPTKDTDDDKEMDGGKVPTPIPQPVPNPMPTPMTPTPTPMPSDEAAEIKKKCTPQAEFISDNSAGAKKFLQHVPDPKLAMIQAAQYICSILYKKASEVPPVTKVTLKLDTHGGVAQASGSNNNKLIQFDTNYINGLSGDVKLELDGVLIHEGTHLWQYSGNGVDGGFIEGIADYVRASGSWYPPGSRNRTGGKYNDAYTTSAYFIGWVNEKYPDFAYKFNLAQKAWPGVGIFKTATGVDVNALWSTYQQQGTFSPQVPSWVAKQVPIQLGL